MALKGPFEWISKTLNRHCPPIWISDLFDSKNSTVSECLMNFTKRKQNIVYMFVMPIKRQCQVYD